MKYPGRDTSGKKRMFGQPRFNINYKLHYCLFWDGVIMISFHCVKGQASWNSGAGAEKAGSWERQTGCRKQVWISKHIRRLLYINTRFFVWIAHAVFIKGIVHFIIIYAASSHSNPVIFSFFLPWNIKFVVRQNASFSIWGKYIMHNTVRLKKVP